MNKFYEGTVKSTITGENGNPKRITEQYLVDGISIGDVEKRMTENMEGSVDIDITSVRLTKYREFIPKGEKDSGEDIKYFSTKVSFISMEDSGKEKKTAVNYMVEASSVEAANKTMVAFMKDTLATYEINNVVETKIVDVLLSEKQF